MFLAENNQNRVRFLDVFCGSIPMFIRLLAQMSGEFSCEIPMFHVDELDEICPVGPLFELEICTHWLVNKSQRSVVDMGIGTFF